MVDAVTGLPGYRRKIRIHPHPGSVTAALEDDIHCMAVTLAHDGERITRVTPVMERWPWTTCPAAGEALVRAFTGLPLAGARAPAQKPSTCTHLYDLAVWAGAHARDAAPLTYDVAVSDPVDGEITAEVSRDGVPVHRWRLAGNRFASPGAIAGMDVMSLSSWIGTLPAAEAEAARVLQWACLVAHGRTMPMSAQSDATKMPAKCHSFQPEVAKTSVRFGQLMDFSAPDARAPLAHFDGESFA